MTDNVQMKYDQVVKKNDDIYKMAEDNVDQWNNDITEISDSTVQKMRSDQATVNFWICTSCC